MLPGLAPRGPHRDEVALHALGAVQLALDADLAADGREARDGLAHVRRHAAREVREALQPGRGHEHARVRLAARLRRVRHRQHEAVGRREARDDALHHHVPRLVAPRLEQVVHVRVHLVVHAPRPLVVRPVQPQRRQVRLCACVEP